ncbi:MAG: PhzF family phenazine biosynthesis isomerase [Acidobacteria bacterium]|nr:PhzF family phenazine biosynthesis isomerase [Acidobacteriota bacterium]
MATPIYTVDAFAERPFQGNPAAVCLLDKGAEASWMQALAAEMNLSETAFLVPSGEAFGLRWFTPAVEVDLCGHATLASAHVLWESGRLASDRPALFDTRSGRLTCTRRGDWIEMDFPASPPRPEAAPEELLTALGAQAVWTGKTRFDYFLELESEQAVRELAPDFRALSRQPVRGVMVTAPGAAPYDFVSRFFAPGSGIDEDPVTGSAHCALAPYWTGKLGKAEMLGFQASARGGAVRVRPEGDRVVLAGRAMTVVQGELRTPPS